MLTILLWAGIALIALGFVCLGIQASIRMNAGADIERFSERCRDYLRRRRYCLLVIFFGMALLAIVLFSSGSLDAIALAAFGHPLDALGSVGV